MTTHMLKRDGRPDQFVLPGLDCPQLYTKSDSQRRRRALLGRFEATAKTESAFWLTFNALTTNDVAFVQAIFGVDDDWALFRRLCRAYKVRQA